MKEFKSYRSYWDFVRSVIWESRYVRTPEQDEFLATVLETSATRTDTILENTVLWRSQIGHDWRSFDVDGEPEREEWPFPPERMKPLLDQASEGRANPRGLPYLYLASDLKTAVAEGRPWTGAFVSVAQMEVLRPLTIVDFSKEKQRLILYGVEPNAKERESAVWRDINTAFSRPVTPNDLLADYVPTQVLAELFRHNGVDGVCYRSALGPGKNFAVFDFDAVKVMNCTLIEVGKVDFNFEERTQYSIRT